MDNRHTYAEDIACIATKLTGKIFFTSIAFSQVLMGEKYRTTGVNDLLFVKYAYGVYFYTSKSYFEANIELRSSKVPPTYVGIDGSLNLYEIK